MVTVQSNINNRAARMTRLLLRTRWKDILRPIYGTIVFQPAAFAWCWMTGASYISTIGPFIIYCTLVFIPIYAAYEGLWAKIVTKFDDGNENDEGG
jgi:hypothetical protein